MLSQTVTVQAQADTQGSRDDLGVAHLADEVAHRDEAAKLAGPRTVLASVWAALVGFGSNAAVALARQL